MDPYVKGRGRLLVRRGFGCTEEERFRAIFMADEGSDEFYLKCGFDEMVRNVNEEEMSPLQEENMKGGEILLVRIKYGGEIEKKTA